MYFCVIVTSFSCCRILSKNRPVFVVGRRSTASASVISCDDRYTVDTDVSYHNLFRNSAFLKSVWGLRVRYLKLLGT